MDNSSFFIAVDDEPQFISQAIESNIIINYVSEIKAAESICCANCDDNFTESGVSLGGFTYYDPVREMYVQVQICKAFSTIFEHGIELGKVTTGSHSADKEVNVMCDKCTTVLSELYKFYTEFMKLTKQSSSVHSIIKQCVVWKQDFNHHHSDFVDTEAHFLSSTENDNDNISDDDNFRPPLMMGLAEDVKQAEVIVSDFRSTYNEFSEVNICEELAATQQNPTLHHQSSKLSEKLPIVLIKKLSPADIYEECLRSARLAFSKKFAQRQRSLRRPQLELSSSVTRPANFKKQRSPCLPQLESRSSILRPANFKKQRSPYIPELQSDSSIKQVANFKRQRSTCFTQVQPHSSITRATNFKNQRFKTGKNVKNSTPKSTSSKVDNTTTIETTNENQGKIALDRYCKLCNIDFPANQYESHRRKVHPEAIRTYTCTEPECNEVFHIISKYEWHLVVKHGIGEKHKDRQCPYCPKYFSRPSFLKPHLKHVHLDKHKFPCPHCPTRCYNETHLKKHIQNVHDETNRHHQCNHCGKIFQSKIWLDIHTRQDHTDVQIYTCPICKKTSNKIYYVHRHIRQVHEKKGKNERCEVCSKTFYFPAALKRHRINVHSGPSVCEECGRSFSQRSSLNNHMILAHTVACPYVCEICGRTFKTKDYLTRHMLSKMHGGEGTNKPKTKMKDQIEVESQSQSQNEVLPAATEENSNVM